MTQETVQLKIGKNTFHVRIPNLMGVAVPAYTPGVPDVRAVWTRLSARSGWKSWRMAGKTR